MLTWGTQGFGVVDWTSFFDDTVSSLTTIFLKDPDSPYKELRHQASLTYASRMESIRQAHGNEKISTLTFRDFKRWYTDWREPDGRNRIAHSHGMMTFVRIAFSFGALARLPGCAVASDTLSKMEFENPKSRTEVVTAEQSAALRKQAHHDGLPSIALTQACQHDLMVRQKDTIGELIPVSHPGISDIIMGDQKWVGGFRWDALDQNMILTHRLSKSIRGRRAMASADSGKVKRWNLTLYPSVMVELAALAGVPVEQLRRDVLPASGPMIIAEHSGRPWRQKVFANKWREIARRAGIPDDVQNRDSRAGGASDAENKNADIEKIRKGLGHSKVETTRIYTRADDEATAQVAVIRFGKKTGKDAT